MSRFSENLSTVNNVVRTGILLVVLGGVSYGGWLGYTTFVQPELDKRRAAEKELAEVQETVRQQQAELGIQSQTIETQKREIAEKLQQIDNLEQENQKLEIAMRLLTVDHRLAHIKVLEVGTEETSDEPYSIVEFVEVDEDGTRLSAPSEYRLRGDEIRIDCWLVKFEDKYIQESDLHRSTTLCVFKSIYGNIDGPMNGKPLESLYDRPIGYARGSVLTEFEKKIWDDFWDIANDQSKAAELGIRANHGQVVYVKPQVNKIYQVDLRASDGLTIRVLGDAPQSPEKPAG